VRDSLVYLVEIALDMQTVEMWAKSHKMPLCRTSALTGEGISELFKHIASCSLARTLPAKAGRSALADTDNQPQGRCCNAMTALRFDAPAMNGMATLHKMDVMACVHRLCIEWWTTADDFTSDDHFREWGLTRFSLSGVA
jgi:hypothetical protein